MLPEVHEGWQRYTRENNIDINLAVGIVVICAGFFLVYFVEELAHLMADRHAHNKADASLHRAVSIRGCPVSLEGPSPPCESSSCKKSDGDVSCQDSTICQLDCDEKEFCRDVMTDGEGCSTFKACSSNKDVTTAAINFKADPERPVHGDSYGTFTSECCSGHVDRQQVLSDRQESVHHVFQR